MNLYVLTCTCTVIKLKFREKKHSTGSFYFQCQNDLPWYLYMTTGGPIYYVSYAPKSFGSNLKNCPWYNVSQGFVITGSITYDI